MSSMEVNNDLILKLAALSSFLEKGTEEEIKTGKVSTDVAATDENEYLSDAELIEDIDANALIRTLYNQLNLNSDGKLDSSELEYFNNALSAMGLSQDDLVEAFENYNKGAYSSGNEDSGQTAALEDEELDNSALEELYKEETSTEPKTTDSTPQTGQTEEGASELSLEDFKKEISKNDKIDDLISEYGYDKVFNLLDKDGNGKITEDEIQKVSASSESIGDVTYGELKKFLGENAEKEDMSDDEFDNLVSKLKESLGIEDSTPTQEAAPVTSGGGTSAGGYSGGGGGGYSGGYGGGGGGGTVNSSSGTKATTAETEEDTLEKLEAEKTKREETLSEAEEGLALVYDGTDEEISGKKEDMDSAEKEYEEALSKENTDEEPLKGYLEIKEENDEAIEKNEEETVKTQKLIDEKDHEIWEQTDLITNLNSELDSLNESLSALNAIEKTDENEADLNAKITDVEGQISSKEEEIRQANEKLEGLETEKEGYETTLGELETAHGTLIETRDKNEANIANAVSQTTKTALEKYQQAREAYETAKTERLEDAQGEVTDARESVEEINQQITEFKNEQTAKENTYNNDAQTFLSELEATGGDAWNDFDTLCSTLNMSREETAEYLTELCNSEEWGDGCIDPVTLCAQIRQESGYNATVYGDGGAALGLGQFHECAVQEVNNQYGTSYTSQDRADPNKALEMMVLLLKYDYKCTGSKDAMLAMYNQGNANGINTSGGQTYVRHVYSRINA